MSSPGALRASCLTTYVACIRRMIPVSTGRVIERPAEPDRRAADHRPALAADDRAEGAGRRLIEVLPFPGSAGAEPGGRETGHLALPEADGGSADDPRRRRESREFQCDVPNPDAGCELQDIAARD